MSHFHMIGASAILLALAGCGESVDQYNAHVSANAVTPGEDVVDASPDSMTTSDAGLPGDGAMAMDNATEMNMQGNEAAPADNAAPSVP